MKLIADISPEDYEYLKSYREFYDTSEGRILKAVCNGKDAMAVIAEVTATVLTELQLEIEKQKRAELSYQQIWNYPLNVCISIIQQKINALEAESEPQAEKEQTDD